MRKVTASAQRSSGKSFRDWCLCSRHIRSWRSHGFSQLEMIFTISVASLMSATLVPKMLPQGGKSTAAYQALRLADDLRHTRLLSMSWGKSLIFNSDANSYRVNCATGEICSTALPAASRCPSPSAAVIDPGHHGPFCIALENGITLSGPSAVQFDLLGRPQYAGGSIRYQLMMNGVVLAMVDVAPMTGYVSTTMTQ